MALVLFFLLAPGPVHSLCLTETVYTLSEGDIELRMKGEFMVFDGVDRRDNVSLGLGILPDLTLWYQFQYIHSGSLKTERDELGDSFLKIWYYAGDIGEFHWGFMARFRFPTGRNAYRETRWQNLSFGNNELLLGPVFMFGLSHLYLHGNAHYVFREGSSGGFYTGFYVNPVRKETYRKVLGLNFASDDTFLEGERLKNDYAVLSIGLNTDCFYPLIPSVEAYASRRFYTGDIGADNIPVEGGSVNPVLCAADMRYFFSGRFYAGVFAVLSLVRREGFYRGIYGFECSMQF